VRYYVRLDRNAGSPTRGDPQGEGASIVLVGVMPYQGVRESLMQGEGKQVIQQRVQATMRYVPASVWKHK
jgi:hypothetical protein